MGTNVFVKRLSSLLLTTLIHPSRRTSKRQQVQQSRRRLLQTLHILPHRVSLQPIRPRFPDIVRVVGDHHHERGLNSRFRRGKVGVVPLEGLTDRSVILIVWTFEAYSHSGGVSTQSTRCEHLIGGGAKREREDALCSLVPVHPYKTIFIGDQLLQPVEQRQ